MDINIYIFCYNNNQRKNEIWVRDIVNMYKYTIFIDLVGVREYLCIF